MLPADPLRGQEARQKQVVIGHRGRSATKYMKTTLTLLLLSIASTFAQPLDWRDNLVYPTNPPRSAVQRENPELKKELLEALRQDAASKNISPEDRFLEAYKTAQEGLQYSRDENSQKARELFLGSKELLHALRKENPDWQPAIIEYRLKYLQTLIDQLPQ